MALQLRIVAQRRQRIQPSAQRLLVVEAVHGAMTLPAQPDAAAAHLLLTEVPLEPRFAVVLARHQVMKAQWHRAFAQGAAVGRRGSQHARHPVDNAPSTRARQRLRDNAGPGASWHPSFDNARIAGADRHALAMFLDDELSIAERWIPLEGSRNFRDIGGYRTEDGARLRWRQLFRSDALGGLSATDAALLRDGLGICSVVDLRHARECERKGMAPIADGVDVRLFHLPLNREDVPDDDPLPDLDDLGTVYLWIARGVGPVLARVLQCIAADDTTPMVFHCAAGKDRTGIVAATLMTLLGVPDDTIAADYALTELVGQAIPDADRAAAFAQYRQHGAPPDALNARPEHMLAFLAGLRRAHGSVRDYLAPFGVGPALVERLRDRFLE